MCERGKIGNKFLCFGSSFVSRQAAYDTSTIDIKEAVVISGEAGNGMGGEAVHNRAWSFNHGVRACGYMLEIRVDDLGPIAEVTFKSHLRDQRKVPICCGEQPRQSPG